MERLRAIKQVDAISSAEVTASPIGLGFEKLDRGIFDPEKAYDHVAALGVKWIRIQSGWARTEREKGIYDFIWLDEIVENLISRGLQPWMCLCYGNGLYNEQASKVFGAVGCPPIFGQEEKRAWHDYVATLTARYQGNVDWYEVWNEPDGKWCWKHGPNGIEYGEFLKATAAAIKVGNPEAKVIGGSICLSSLDWLNDVMQTGAASCMDALTYHAYNSDETIGFNRVRALKALCRRFNPGMEFIQGETGAQSRSDGAGALAGAAWTPRRQAKFLARHMMADLFEQVKFTSYFSCMDMVEALKGDVNDKTSYLDYAYFGVLSAEFDEKGMSTGEYVPKPSYRTLQVIAALFRESVELVELPVLICDSWYSPRLLNNEVSPKDVLCGGFRKANGASAFVYWRPTALLKEEYESTISLEVSVMAGEPRLIDLVDGTVYAFPEEMIEDNGRGHLLFRHIPLRDYPLALTFGDF